MSYQRLNPLNPTDLSATLRNAVRGQSGIALHDAGGALEWSGLWARIAALDDAFAAANLGAGTIISVPGRNTIEAAASCIGSVATGRCAMLVNPFQPLPAMIAGARAGRPDAILLEERFLDDSALDPCDRVFVLKEDGTVRLHRAPAGAAETRTDAALIMSTSGTTGQPKKVPISSHTLAQALSDIGIFNSGFGDRPKDDGSWAPLLQYSPLAHIGGVLTLLRGVMQARPIVLFAKFEPQRWAEAVAEHCPVTTGLPPAMMRMVLDASIPSEALSSLVSVWSGSAPVKEDTTTAFTTRYGIPVLGNYGATEFCGAVATWTLRDYHAFHDTRSAATGRIRSSIANARVRDPATGAILPTGETGVLEIQVHRVGPEWLATTDLAHLDEENFLYLHGRADDAIVRGGFKISPETVAGMLRQHQAVRDAIVVGIADERLGQVPAAAVELLPGHHADEAQLIAFVRENLPAYFAPTAVRVVSALPRTPAMKIDRGAVRALFEN